MYLIGFPLLVITFAIYNMIAFLMPSLTWTANVATIHLISGQDWTVTTEDIVLAAPSCCWASRSSRRRGWASAD